MYTISDIINCVEYKGLQATKLLDINAKEILHISLEEDSDSSRTHITKRCASISSRRSDFFFY